MYIPKDLQCRPTSSWMWLFTEDIHQRLGSVPQESTLYCTEHASLYMYVFPNLYAGQNYVYQLLAICKYLSQYISQYLQWANSGRCVLKEQCCTRECTDHWSAQPLWMDPAALPEIPGSSHTGGPTWHDPQSRPELYFIMYVCMPIKVIIDLMPDNSFQLPASTSRAKWQKSLNIN